MKVAPSLSFFYNGPNSRAIAFEGLLNSGVDFGNRLISGFGEPTKSTDGEPALLSDVATDGESYGHHHRHGEMALSYAIHWLEDEQHIQLINYAAFLAKYPRAGRQRSSTTPPGAAPTASNAGARTVDVTAADMPAGTREWRAALRIALDQLRDATVPLAEQVGASLFKDLWAARDSYIRVILDRSRPNTDAFFAEFATRRTHSGGAHSRARADGVGTSHSTDVHQLRLVL